MEGAWGGVPSLGTLEDTFGMSPDADISLYGGGPLLYGEPGLGGSYVGDCDGCMKEGYIGGVPLCEGLH